MDINAILEKTELLCDISEGARNEIAANGKLRSISQNEILFLEGDEGSTFYILIEGGIKLYKGAPDGREITIRLVKPQEMFAETILFEKDKYPVNASAVINSTLFSIQRVSFHHLLEKLDFRREFIAFLMKKMRYLTGRILYLTSFDVEERFFKFILDRYGKLDSYEINLPKKDIASAIGTIPETFSRLLLRLKKNSILDWEGSTLNIQKGYIDNFDYED